MTCPRNRTNSDYYAPELANDQTLENLDKFSDRLDAAHERIKAAGHCTCSFKTAPKAKKKRGK